MRSTERRIEDYRRAFVLLCDEPFDELDKTLARMLEVLAITLDVSRVSFWTFEEPQQTHPLRTPVPGGSQRSHGSHAAAPRGLPELL